MRGDPGGWVLMVFILACVCFWNATLAVVIAVVAALVVVLWLMASSGRRQ